MKRLIPFLLLLGFTLIVKAQYPADLSADDFSTKTDIFTDPRDGKSYAYKTYGKYDWFMQNLNWDGYDGTNENTRGTVGSDGPAEANNANGTRFGRYYTKDEAKSKTKPICPEGWNIPEMGDWGTLVETLNLKYNLPDLKDFSAAKYTFLQAGYYLRGGSTGEEGLWKLGEKDDINNTIQFNLLPSGWLTDFTTFNTEVNKGLGYSALTFTGAGDLYWTGTSTDAVNDNHANLRHSNKESYGNTRCIRYNDFKIVPIPDEYYPTVFTIKQINGAAKEQNRLRQSQKKYDKQPTGFYINKGEKVVVDVEITKASADFSSPVLTIGTLGLILNDNRKEYTLRPGKNEVTAADDGLIYLSFVTTRPASPVGEARITFTSESKHVRAPKYIYGKTTDEEFESMLAQYQTRDIILYSDYVIVANTRTNGLSLLMKEDKKKWMDMIHDILAWEDEISGLDSNDPNPLHHRHTPGEVRHLMCENASASPHAAGSGYTGYPTGDAARYLTYNGYLNRDDASWMVGHELGHQHQQSAYQIPQSTESTVNLYAYVVERAIRKEIRGLAEYNRTPAAKWETIHNTFLKLPIEERIYDMNDNEMQTKSGDINYNEVRFMPWEQLFLIFGNDFYKKLHRHIRELNLSGGSDEERRYCLILRASEVAGYDLRDFFNEWGIRVSDGTLLNQLNQKFTEALADNSIIALPQPVSEIISITGQNPPSWAPLPIRGVTNIETTTPDTTLRIYPNPVVAGQALNIDLSDMPVNAQPIVGVYNLSGQLIMQESATTTLKQLTITEPGIYMITVESDNYKKYDRIIVR